MQPIDLERVPAEIWRHLDAARGGWRTPVVASAASGGGADARIVVLRSVDERARELTFFTDRRSRKCAQLHRDARVCLVVHDQDRNLQVRLYGAASEVRAPGRLDGWWAELQETQRAHYAADAGGNEKGRENFTAFAIVVDRLHCLWITSSGNEAAEFSWRDGQWRGHFVRP